MSKVLTYNHSTKEFTHEIFENRLGQQVPENEVLDYLPENEKTFECSEDIPDGKGGWLDDIQGCGAWERQYHWHKDEMPTTCEELGGEPSCEVRTTGKIVVGEQDYNI